MKKNILVVLFLIFALQTINAQKCKPMSKSTDEFTGKTTIIFGTKLTSMSVYSLGIKYVPLFGVFKSNGENKAFLQLEIDGNLSNDLLLNKHIWFEKGSKFYIKLENEVIELTVEASEVRRNRVFLVYSITDEQIQKLISQKLIVAKSLPFIDSQEMIFKFKIAKGRDKKLKEQLKCFMN